MDNCASKYLTGKAMLSARLEPNESLAMVHESSEIGRLGAARRGV
jgi:hypothetical protein